MMTVNQIIRLAVVGVACGCTRLPVGTQALVTYVNDEPVFREYVVKNCNLLDALEVVEHEVNLAVPESKRVSLRIQIWIRQWDRPMTLAEARVAGAKSAGWEQSMADEVESVSPITCSLTNVTIQAILDEIALDTGLRWELTQEPNAYLVYRPMYREWVAQQERGPYAQ